MMPSISDLNQFSPRQRKRKEIILEFYKIRANKPHVKKNVLIREVAIKLRYPIDCNKSNSQVATVIREWEKS